MAAQTGAELIAAERQRQIYVEGYTPEHDDEHNTLDLSRAAACYRGTAYRQAGWECDFHDDKWPWEPEDFKPSDAPVRNLVKAGALWQANADRHRRAGDTRTAKVIEHIVSKVAAEIDRLQAEGV